MTPRETDEQLAELYHMLYDAEDRLTRIGSTLLNVAGAEYYYRGRQRVTDMQVEEAQEKVQALVSRWDAYAADPANTITEDDGWTHPDYRKWDGPMVREIDTGRDYLAKYEEQEAKINELEASITKLQSTYTGWSRFFLVTSSPGHIHSHMSCSTCRPTTRFGWLPQLSGKGEAEAVKELGPTLCTVCFPSAPTKWTEGKKLTAAQAAKKVA